ncbi:MAG: hypothetical protein KGJ41_10635 [Rhodospirillales bacterium]|nr:hypothetical protein [Rhodospirillales bacterium]MDE2199466.1 hypothetical protein [Rhodospirillales bacterium]MDE2574660.1 hypothetical protein [Rhodospirillales bacterium]
MSETKLVKVRYGNYKFDPDKDADLQATDKARSEIQLKMDWDGLFKSALTIIFEKISGYTKGKIDLKVSEFAADFVATQMAPLGGHRLAPGVKPMTGNLVPVEWKLRRRTGQDSSAMAWQVMVDIDDVPPGLAANGPDRPHVGYLLTGKSGGTGKDIRIDGHIFVEFVPASRNAPGSQPTVAATAPAFSKPLQDI